VDKPLHRTERERADVTIAAIFYNLFLFAA